MRPHERGDLPARRMRASLHEFLARLDRRPIPATGGRESACRCFVAIRQRDRDTAFERSARRRGVRDARHSPRQVAMIHVVAGGGADCARMSVYAAL